MWSEGADWRDGANHPKYVRGVVKDIYQEIMFDGSGKSFVYKTRYLVQPENLAEDKLMFSSEFKLSNEPNDILKGML